MAKDQVKTVSFEEQREKALKELEKHGNPPYNPEAYYKK
jgi:hypothetical protein